MECYLIKDAEELKLKTRVWEEMNREYLDKQVRYSRYRRYTQVR